MQSEPNNTENNGYHNGDVVFVLTPKYSWALGDITETNPTINVQIKEKHFFCCSAKNDEDHDDNDDQHKMVCSIPAKDIETHIVLASAASMSSSNNNNDKDKDDSAVARDVSDLLSLSALHEATLLRCLYKRYLQDLIYTNIGAIVVAFNPFNYKIPWYVEDGSNMERYLATGSDTHIQPQQSLLPHTWVTAHNAYVALFSSNGDNYNNQTILVSGESGAGKTVAAKVVMKYLG
eukprot:PhM_4_TR7231/c0_g1_i1/m.99531